MLTSIGKNLFGHTSGVRASSMHNNCFLEVCYIIVNHLVQFFETIQSETEGSEPQKPGGFGPRIALLMRLFVWDRDIRSVYPYVGEELSQIIKL